MERTVLPGMERYLYSLWFGRSQDGHGVRALLQLYLSRSPPSPVGQFIMVNNASPDAEALSSINGEYSTSLKIVSTHSS